MIWFTSDLHLGHPAIINMCERPFDSVEEMNETLIRNFNSCVKQSDTVYILGDIAHRALVTEINRLIGRLNGKKYYVKAITTRNMLTSYLREFMISWKLR